MNWDNSFVNGYAATTTMVISIATMCFTQTRSMAATNWFSALVNAASASVPATATANYYYNEFNQEQD